MLTYYKELNVYKRSHKVAIDLHNFLSEDKKITPDQSREFNSLMREVLSCIAEGASARTPKARRFLNFKARDAIHQILMDFDFCHDIGSLSHEDYERFSKELDIASAMLWKLNQSILEKQNEPESAPADKEVVTA